MKRRGLLLGLSTTGVAAGILTSTGALSSANTQRTLAVDVADDTEAYLRLDPDKPGYTNSAYASENDGALQINLTEGTKTAEDDKGQDVTADGISPFAITTLEQIFAVENQGTNAIEVSVVIEDMDSDLSNKLDVIATDVPDKGENFKTSLIDGSGNLPQIGPGESFAAGIEIDATGDDLTDLERFLSGLQVTIQAIAISDGGSS